MQIGVQHSFNTTLNSKAKFIVPYITAMIAQSDLLILQDIGEYNMFKFFKFKKAQTKNSEEHDKNNELSPSNNSPLLKETKKEHGSEGGCCGGCGGQ